MLGVFGAIALAFLAKYVYLIIKFHLSENKDPDKNVIKENSTEMNIENNIPDCPQGPPPIGRACFPDESSPSDSRLI